MRSVSWLVVCVFALALMGSTAAQDVPEGPQELAAAPWYMVLYNDTKGQLIWVNSEGVEAVTSRVAPPGDIQGGPDTRSMTISPDGRYGIFSAPSPEGPLSLIFYNFERARPIKNYLADAGERVWLGPVGRGSNFTPDSTRVVVLFYTFDEHITDWRLVEFDVTTGEPLHTLKRSDTSFEVTMTGGGIAPYVYFAADDAYHFSMSAYAIEGQQTFDAYAWTPTTGSILLLGPISSQFDVLPATGRILQSFHDEAQPFVTLPGPLPIFNAITQREGMTAGIERLVDDDSATLLDPKWASGGAWIAYQSIGLDESNWVVRPVDLDSPSSHPRPLPQQFYGTSDGYVLSFDDRIFSASTQVDGSDLHVIYEAPEGNEVRVVYITPQDQTFAPMTLAYRPPRTDPVALPTETVCVGAPATRLAVGMTARTLSVPSMGIQAVTLYVEPNQTMTFGIGVGTEFVISEGPVCEGGALWWKTTIMQGSDTTTGWLREGDATAYYLEPVP